MLPAMAPFAAALVVSIALTGAPPRVPPTAAKQADALRIVVIDGEDAVNIVQQKTAVAPVVEVRDRNDQPVAGAIVRFAIRQGRGTFAGARTLSVTTNAAGRAVATGLTPTGSGALQIGASATFQGQTAVATITQTNVMTAAQAAAASSGGASGTAAPGSAAGGGGSGGLSGTTLGVVGGAAAGGALVAVSALGGGGEEASGVTTTYRGSFSLQSVFNSTTTTNGVVTGSCANQPVAITGNITVTLNESGAGDIEMDWTETMTATGQCLGIAPSFRASGMVSSAASITLASEFPAEYQSPAGTVRLRRSETFSGALDGNVVKGIVTMSHENTLIAPAGPGIVFTGGYPAASTGGDVDEAVAPKAARQPETVRLRAVRTAGHADAIAANGK